MGKLSETKKLAIVAGVSVLLCGAGGGGVYWSKGLAAEKQLVIDGMKGEIEAAKVKIRKIPQVEHDVIILRENLNYYVKILPEEQELNEFVRMTHKFIAQSGVNVSRFQPGPQDRNSGPFERVSYKFEFKATLWQFMQFMNSFENYDRFAQVNQFNLTAGADRDVRLEQEVTHNVTMTVETFVYHGSPKGRDVQIQNYAQKVANMREEIIEERPEKDVRETYKFLGPRGRRDVFIDPRETSAPRPGGPSAGLSPDAQRKIVNRLRDQLGASQEILHRLDDKALTIFDRYTLERQLREELDAVDREVQAVTADQRISHAPLKLVWTREVLEPLAELKRTAALVRDGGDDRFLSHSEMTDLLERMKSALRVGALSTAIDEYDRVEAGLRVGKEDDARYPLRQAIEGLYLRAKVATEFSELELDVSGICVKDTGNSGVVLNGVVYQEGEYIDGDLLIKNVGRDRIEFVYKGFTVVRTL